jgi:Carboxypeptidase regulatory-like domain
MKNPSLFKCTQQELYLAVPIAWALFLKHLARFTKLKGFYTEGYAKDRLTELAAAKAIPNFKTRKDEPTTHRIYMDSAVEDCCHFFLMLQSLIGSAFSAELLEAKYDTSGLSFFEKAEQGNEAAINDLNESAIQFIQKNEAALKANNVMQDSFLPEYQAVVAAYTNHRTSYTNSSKTASELTKDNTEANNNIYKIMMAMLADGRIIFRKEPELRDLFAFTTILDKVVSSSVAGVRGKVKFGGLKKPFPTAKMTIEGTNKEVETNKLGKYDVPQLANGAYTLIFTCPGFKDVVVEGFEVKTGVYNTLNVEMVAITEGVSNAK